MTNKVLVSIVTVGALLLVVFGGLYIYDRSSTPEKVFYKMIENNLRIGSVSRTVTQDSPEQSLTQATLTQTGDQNVVQGRTELSQGEGAQQTTVVTESIATPDTDYIRYVDINTAETGASGLPLDFSGVLGTWGRSELATPGERRGELFGEATLGIVPFGRLDNEQSQELIRHIKELSVYEIDFAATTKTSQNGRKAYVYEAQIRPDKYVQMLQKFAEYIGTAQLEDLDADNFKNSPSINITFEVDVLSRQLVAASFTDSERRELYRSYGLNKNVTIPENTIPVSELQQRLQSIQ